MPGHHYRITVTVGGYDYSVEIAKDISDGVWYAYAYGANLQDESGGIVATACGDTDAEAKANLIEQLEDKR